MNRIISNANSYYNTQMVRYNSNLEFNEFIFDVLLIKKSNKFKPLNNYQYETIYDIIKDHNNEERKERIARFIYPNYNVEINI
jgi:hypothetical protein